MKFEKYGHRMWELSNENEGDLSYGYRRIEWLREHGTVGVMSGSSLPFLGKWALTNSGNAVTVDLGSQQMCMSGFDSSPNDEQRLNLYGSLDPSDWGFLLQAGNGNYLTWMPPTYWLADEPHLDPELDSPFLILDQGNGAFLVQCSTGSGGMNMSAQGMTLVGVYYGESTNDSMLFENQVLTPGLADLLASGGGQGLDLRWVSFAGVDLTGIKLPACDLSNADLSGAVLTDADLSGANLSGAKLRQVMAKGVNFAGADLSGADFSGATLRGANMNQATIRSADFAGADLSEVSALAGGEGVSFVGCDLSNSILESAKLEGARFAADDGLPAAVLVNALMPNADLTSANLVSVDLSGVQLYGSNAKADSAHLRNADLAKANLATMDLSQVNMDGAALSYANLVNTNLRGASLGRGDNDRAVSLAFVSLQGTDLTGASLPGADLTNAAVALSIQGPAETFVGVPLFDSTDTSLVSDLDQRKLSTDVQNAFSSAGFALIATATITVVETGQQWSIDNYDQSGTSGLQSTYGTFSLILPTGQPNTIRVYGSPPLLVIAYDADNEQIQQAPQFSETVGLTAAIDDDTTCPNGMRWSQRNHGVDVETLMTAAEPPHPPACVPSENNWCYLR
ncbi:pentapeptide repeat-containing protein [Nocardia sp. NPDC101769]|uniref:pentapeptide repeat-containing protein n=1 Tax=Nocardia sp. NPDC101769 TaxID=3364333 RepID=UPI0037FAD1D9